MGAKRFLLLLFVLALSTSALSQNTTNAPWVTEIITQNNNGSAFPAIVVRDSVRLRVCVVGTTTSALPGLPAVSGSSDIFVSCYNEANGALVYHRQFGSNGAERAVSAMVRRDNFDLVVVGTTTGQIGTSPKVGTLDAFIVVFNSVGNVRWSYQFGVTGGKSYPLGIQMQPDIYARYSIIVNAQDPAHTTIGNNTLIFLSVRWDGRVKFQIKEKMVTGAKGYFQAYAFAAGPNRTLIGYELWENMTEGLSRPCTFPQFPDLAPQQYWIRSYDHLGRLRAAALTNFFASNTVSTGRPAAYLEPNSIIYSSQQNVYYVFGQSPGTKNPYVGPQTGAQNTFQGCFVNTNAVYSAGIRLSADLNRTTQVRLSDNLNAFTVNTRFTTNPIATTAASGQVILNMLLYSASFYSQINYIVLTDTTPTNRIQVTLANAPAYGGPIVATTTGRSVFLSDYTKPATANICSPYGSSVRNALLGITTASTLVRNLTLGTTCDSVGTSVIVATQGTSSSFYATGTTTGSFTGYRNTAKNLITWLIKGNASVPTFPTFNFYCNVGPTCSNPPSPSPPRVTPTPSPRPDCSNGTHCPCVVMTFPRCLTPIPGNASRCEVSECSGLTCDCASSFFCRLEVTPGIVQTDSTSGNIVSCARSQKPTYPVPVWAPL